MSGWAAVVAVHVWQPGVIMPFANLHCPARTASASSCDTVVSFHLVGGLITFRAFHFHTSVLILWISFKRCDPTLLVASTQRMSPSLSSWPSGLHPISI